jgi:hypothetical protein
MGIAGQVFEDMFRAFDRLTHANYPVFGIQLVFKVAKRPTYKFEQTGFAGMLNYVP